MNLGNHEPTALEVATEAVFRAEDHLPHCRVCDNRVQIIGIYHRTLAEGRPVSVYDPPLPDSWWREQRTVYNNMEMDDVYRALSQKALFDAERLFRRKMMPLLGSTTALAVYTVNDTSAITADKLVQYAFRSIDDLPEERGWGWVNIEDMFDTEWRVSPPDVGGYMCFSLRVDTRKVSGAVLKKHLADALREEEGKAAAEGRKVPRGRKKDLKELLLSKLRSQTEPVPSAMDVVVDMDSGQIFVLSVSSAQLELFEEYFATSFGLKPERFLIDAADGQKLLATIHENGLTPTVGEYTWLLEQGSQASLMHPETGATVNAKDEPEAVSRALAAGLVFTRLQCRLARKDEESLEWMFTLGAEGVITGLKTPKVEKSDNDSTDGALLEKIYLLEQVVGVIKGLVRE